MEPVSHALFGRALGTSGRLPRPAGIVLAAVLGSWLPDIDAVFAFGGFDRYLQVHASWTHALLSTPFEAAVLAGVLRLMIRRARFVPLCIGAWAGVAGHIFCDVANGSDIALLAPLTMRTFGWHVVSMVEPAVLAILVTAGLISWRRPASARVAALGALGMIAALLIGKTSIQARARGIYESQAGRGRVTSTRIAPVAGSLFSWTIFDRAGEHVRAWSVNTWAGSVTLLFDRTDAAASPLAESSLGAPAVARFLSLDGIPFARIEREGDRTLVLWSDVRKCSADNCTESFGAVFDARAQLIGQVIRVGPVERRRPVKGS